MKPKKSPPEKLPHPEGLTARQRVLKNIQMWETIQRHAGQNLDKWRRLLETMERHEEPD